MSEPKDHPNVIAFPPLILAAFLLLSWGLGYVVVLDRLPPPFSGMALVLGVPVLTIAGTLGVTGILAFRRAGTHVEPFQPTLVIVRDGPYRFTRNPMYLGLIGVHIGVGLICSLDWTLVLAPFLWLTLHRGVVLREEAYLTNKFGADYTDYLKQTRRWI